MEDIAACLAEARNRVPGVPRFLYGHSLGGLLVLTYVLRQRPDLAGVVVSSAGLRSPVLEQQLKMTAAKLLGSTLPTIAIPSGLDDSGLSRDPAVIEAYRADPLVHDKASFALGKDGAQGADWALAHAGDFALPLLMLHGSDDPIAYVRGTEEFASKVEGDVTVEIYEGLLHEPHNEPEKDEVLADIVEWLDAHVRSAPRRTCEWPHPHRVGPLSCGQAQKSPVSRRRRQRSSMRSDRDSPDRLDRVDFRERLVMLVGAGGPPGPDAAACSGAGRRALITSQIPPSIARNPRTPTMTSLAATPATRRPSPTSRPMTPIAMRRRSPAPPRALRMLVANLGSSA